MDTSSFWAAEHSTPDQTTPPAADSGTPPYHPNSAPRQERQPRIVALPLPAYKVRWTYIILGVTALVYALSAFYSRSFDPSTDVLYLLGAKFDPAIRDGEWWRLVAPIFLHANLLHIASNSYALYILGTMVERRYGPMRFLAIYFVSGIGGSIVSFGLNNGLAVGASGAILGVLGTQVAFFYTHRAILGETGKAMLQNAFFNVVLIFGIGLAVSNIDSFAHLGGLLTGIALGYVLRPRYAFDQSAHGSALIITDTGKPLRYWPMAAGVVVVLLALFALFLATPSLTTIFSPAQ